ncbi:MAG: NUDIX domain-containing protein [Chloroflexi bacterium]|nr:NUDIX domain-containing protein [Chloroflexota bacterium]
MPGIKGIDEPFSLGASLGRFIGEALGRIRFRRHQIITPRVGANAVIFDDEGRVLLTKRQDNGLWCLPGGHMDLGETIQETAIRETEEETGLKVAIERLVGVYSRPHPCYVYKDPRKQILVVTFVCRPIGGSLRLSAETTDFGYFSPDKLPGEMLPGHEMRIADALGGGVTVR